MNEDNNSELLQAQSTFSFGKRLASARGALNLSREDVAKELRLGVDIITALEEEDYDRLAVPIFVTGYLRNYARLLKIPVEPLLAAYSQIQVDTPTLVADAARKPGPSYSKLVIKVASLLIALVLIAGIVSWVQNQNFEFSSLSSFFTIKQGPATTEPVVATPVLPELIEVDEPPVTEEALVTDMAQLPEDEPAQIPVESKPEPPKPEPPKPEVKNEPVTPPQHQLLISVSEDSWVEIEDSEGKRLIYDLLREGRQYRLAGSPPYKVFLGNAKAVRIEYNGELIGLDKYIRDNLARFRIGAAGE